MNGIVVCIAIASMFVLVVATAWTRYSRWARYRRSQIRWPLVRRSTMSRKIIEANNSNRRRHDASIEQERRQIEVALARLSRVRVTRGGDIMEWGLRICTEVMIDTRMVQEMLQPNGPGRDYTVDRMVEGIRKYLYTIDFAAVPHIQDLSRNHPQRYWHEPIVPELDPMPIQTRRKP